MRQRALRRPLRWSEEQIRASVFRGKKWISAIRLGSYRCQRGRSSLGSTCDSFWPLCTQVSSAGTHVTKRVLLHFSRSRLVVDCRSSLQTHFAFLYLFATSKATDGVKRNFWGNSYELLSILVHQMFQRGRSQRALISVSSEPLTHIPKIWFQTLLELLTFLKYIRLLDSDITRRVWNELSFKPSV